MSHDLKSRDSATNCVWDLRVFAFDNARIDIPYDGVHDGACCSPFALVLATDPFQKDNGHTESLTSVRRTISTSNGRATSQGGANEIAAPGRSIVPLDEARRPDGESRTRCVVASSTTRTWPSDQWRLSLRLHGVGSGISRTRCRVQRRRHSHGSGFRGHLLTVWEQQEALSIIFTALGKCAKKHQSTVTLTARGEGTMQTHNVSTVFTGRIR